MINESTRQGESLKSGPSRRARIIMSLCGIVALTPLTVMAMTQLGVIGVFASTVVSSASMQIYLDLVIACLLISVWIWHDSRKTGRWFWPWFVLTLAAGSFGPLFYVLVGALREPRSSK